MIIRRERDHYLLVTQADHAALSAHIMAHWQLDAFPSHPRRDTILTATREHDNGWMEEDATTLVDAAGEPVDFISAPVPVKHRIWPRAVARAAQTDAYVAALIAQHALTVHGQQRPDPLWTLFLRQMERLRDEQLAGCTAAQRDALGPDYTFVQVGDQLSLIFCNGWTTPFARPGGRTILRGTTLEVTPDPFGGARVPLRIEARRVPARAYASPRELRAACDTAATVTLEGVATGI
jgi:hypothetical protein